MSKSSCRMFLHVFDEKAYRLDVKLFVWVNFRCLIWIELVLALSKNKLTSTLSCYFPSENIGNLTRYNKLSFT